MEPFHELVVKAKAGDRIALGKIFSLTEVAMRPYVGAIGSRIGNPSIRDSDVMQDVYLKAQMAFRQFQGTTERAFMGWFLAIFFNHCEDIRRSLVTRKSKAELGRPVSLDTSKGGLKLVDLLFARIKLPLEILAHEENQKVLEKVLKEIPPVEKEAIEMRFVQGLSYSAMGEKLNRTAEACRKLVERAREHIAYRLKREAIELQDLAI